MKRSENCIYHKHHVSSTMLIAALATGLKLLLIPASFSTDFEVHRHWKALTRSRLLAEWYTDQSSQWTLDYPPLFAFFERMLAELAAYFHPPLVDVASYNLADSRTILFMRLSVISTDLLLVYGAFRFVRVVSSASSEVSLASEPVEKSFSGETGTSEASRNSFKSSNLHDRSHVLNVFNASIALILMHPGLILIDNIHFQYNGLVLAILLLSIALLMENCLCAGAIMFSVALNLKHTLLPVAPTIGMYIILRLRTYFSSSSFHAISLFGKISGAVLSVFGLAWLPLYAAGGFPAVVACLARLFPFNRGLLHAYWAPNIWSIYASIDKIAAYLGCNFREPDLDVSSGKIGALRPFRCLPNIVPTITAAFVAANIAVVLIQMWHFCQVEMRNEKEGNSSLHRGSLLSNSLPWNVAFSALSGFLFGWHVHEKMILLTTLILSGSVLSRSAYDQRVQRFAFALLSTAGNYALFPLITTPGEAPLKILHLAGYSLFMYFVLFDPSFHVAGVFGLSKASSCNPPKDTSEAISCTDSSQERSVSTLRILFLVYLASLAVVELYAGVGGLHKSLFGSSRWAFLPLMIISAHCAVAICLGYILLLPIPGNSIICSD